MSARSRYLAAISPKNESDEPQPPPPPAPSSSSSFAKTTTPSNQFGPSRTYSRNVVSPSNIAARGGRSGVANVHFGGVSIGETPANVGDSSKSDVRAPSKGLPAVHALYGGPPPPPPPGPPPKKNKKKTAAAGAADEATNSHSASSNASSNAPFGAGKLRHPQPSWSQQPQQSNNSYRAQTQTQTRTQTRTRSGISENDENGRPSPTRSTRGEQWSPREEIQSGNVAKFKQMLWGGQKEASGAADSAANATDVRSPSKLSRSPYNSKKDGAMLDGNSSEEDNRESHSLRWNPQQQQQQQQQSQLQQSQLQQSQQQPQPQQPQPQPQPQQQQDPYPHGAQRAPPSTPPRPQGPSSKNKGWITSPSGAARGSSIRNSSPPKYKMKAPPPLDRGATPSLAYNSLEDQNDIDNDNDNDNENENEGHHSQPHHFHHQQQQQQQQPQPHQHQHQYRSWNSQPPHHQPLGTPPRSSVAPPSRVLHNRRSSPNSKSNLSPANATPPTSRPSPLRQRLGNLTPLDTSFDDPTTPAFGIGYTPTPTAASNHHHNNNNNNNNNNNSNTRHPDLFDRHPTEHRDSDRSTTQPPSPKASGIQTLTAFKRPNRKVGIIFTRQSKEHPDVAVISQIFPESIFASHAREYHRANNVSLEGAEVIAVNGVPVRDPRHGAELVAKAVEEVRLTVKRGDIASDVVEEELDDEDVDDDDDDGDDGDDGDGVGLPTGNDDEWRETHRDSQPIGNEDVDETREWMQSRDTLSEEGSIPENTDETTRPVSPPYDSYFERSRRGSVDRDDAVTDSDSEMSVATEAAEAAAMESDLVPTEPQSYQTPKKNQEWSLDSKSQKSRDIAEKRRQIAQAMLLSAEMVEDPIENSPVAKLFVGVSTSDDWDASQDWDKDASRHDDDGGDSEQSSERNDVDEDAQTDAPVVEEKMETSSMHAQRSQSKPKPVISAAEKRRLVALQMYNSEDMVADNVDDFRLGTIDAISPNAKSKISMGIQAINDSTHQLSGSSDVSVANMTDITTNSATTAKMGPTTPRHRNQQIQNELGFSDGKSGKKTSIGVESRIRGEGSGVQGSIKASDPTPDAIVADQPSNEAPSSSSNPSVSKSAQVKSFKTDDDSSSIAASSVAISDHSGDSRSGRSFFGSKKKWTTVGANDGQAPNESKKKKSLFGVAKLIRKASSKKGKSTKKGRQDEEFNLFVDETTSSLSAKNSASTSEVKSNTPAQPKSKIASTSADPPSKSSYSPQKISPSPVKEEALQENDENDNDLFNPVKMDTRAPFQKDLQQTYEPNDVSFFDEAKPADFSNWEDDSFFNLKSPFKEKTTSSSFGFPETDTAKTTDVFDAWGEPSTMIPAPTFDSKDQFDPGGIDFHSQDTDDHFVRKKDFPFDNGDVMSHDGTEMSEVTNPTFASAAAAVRLDQDGDDGSKHTHHVKKGGSGGTTLLPVTKSSYPNRESSPGSSSNEPSESAMPLLADSDLSKRSPGSSGSVASNNVQQNATSNSALVKPEQRPIFDGNVRDPFQEKENYSGKTDIGLHKRPLPKTVAQKSVVSEVHADDPPLSMSLETMESSGDEKEDFEVDRVKAINSDDSHTNTFAVKSRILSKYAKSGKTRKQIRPGIRDSISQVPERLTKDNRDEERKLPSDVSQQLPKVLSKPSSKYDESMITTPIRTNESNRRNNPNIKNQVPYAEPKTQDQTASQRVTDPLKNKPSGTQGSNEQPPPSRYRRRPDLMVKQEPSKSELGANPHLQVASAGPKSSQTYRRKAGRSSPRPLETSASKSFSPDNQSAKAIVSGKNRYSYSAKKKNTPSFVDDPNYYSMEHRLMQIKDPIQRAGVRLLWAAAIPIQTQARRYLARQLAIKKMCAVLTIQSFIRRWLAERDLEIALWSAIQIQAAWRGWFARDSLEDNHYCATQIQRVVRGYLATMHVFEDLYSITIVQSVVRMHFAINKAVDRLSSIIVIQAWYRGVQCRRECREREYSAIAIQSNWRRYMSQMSYQFDIIDIIIVQSIVRRRKAILVRKGLCATKIQAAWRSYDCSMAYVHTLADVITVQSVVRRWLTLRHLAAIRIQCAMRVFLAKKRFAEDKALYILVTRHTSATKIQSAWRSYSAQVRMLVSIVNIIVIQSLWRKRKIYSKYGPYLKRIRLARERKKNRAAVKIQAIWRGFVACTTFIIFKYETQASTMIQKYWRRYMQVTSYSLIYLDIVKIQAVVRGHQERSWQNFRADCATIIQAASRRFLVRKECHNECMISILIAAAATSLRMRNSVTKIQRWWYQEMLSRRQKQAALIIERFFIYVKKEVEKEVKALKKKKKERRLRRKMRQSDEWILERAWLNTVEDIPVVPEGKPISYHNDYLNIDPGIGQRIYTKHDRYSSEPEPSINAVIEEDAQSEVSGLTDLSFGNRHRMGHQTRKIRKTMQETEEDNSLDEAFFDTESKHTGGKPRGNEGFNSRYTHQNHSSKHASRGRTPQYGRYPSRR